MATTETRSTWFYQHKNRVLGPVDSDELRFLALTGKVNCATLVRTVGATEWIEYSVSPVAINAAAEKSPKHPVKNAMRSNLKEVAATDSNASDLTSGSASSLLSSSVSNQQKSLRIVSAAAILAAVGCVAPLILGKCLINPPNYWRRTCWKRGNSECQSGTNRRIRERRPKQRAWRVGRHNNGVLAE